MTTKKQQNEDYIKSYVEETGKDWLFLSSLPHHQTRNVKRCESVLAIEGNKVYLKSGVLANVKRQTTK